MDDDDLIVLNAFGQRTEWRFPEHLSECPVQACPAIRNRSAAILHFKREHAQHYIHCSICDKAIKGSYFKEHYRKIHRNVKMQFDFIEKPKQSEQQMPETNKVSIFSKNKTQIYLK